jgi:hypothetical protein
MATAIPPTIPKMLRTLQDLMKIQHSYGLNIKWLSPQDYNEIVPGSSRKVLRAVPIPPRMVVALPY